MIKKIVLVSFLLIALGAYALWNTLSAQNTTPITVASTATASSQDSAPVQQQQPPQPQAVPPQQQNQGTYKNGTYTGTLADAFYGPLQVQAVITNGRLSNVVFLQYPNDNPHSQEVSSIALPYLKQEAISAQSAQVDAVSGATATSQAFSQSLASALNKAL